VVKLPNPLLNLINGNALTENLEHSGHATGEITHVSKDGTLIPTEVRSHQFRLNGKTVILSICRDLTERKKRERENLELLVQTMISERVSDLLSKIDSATYLNKGKFGDFSFSPSLKEVSYRGKQISLTPVESSILRLLLAKSGHVLTHSELSQVLGHHKDHCIAKCIRVYIHNLREKIENDPSNPQLILTKEGKGYYIPKS